MRYASEFKTKIVLESLQTSMPIRELALHYQISYKTILRWKKRLLENAASIFPSISYECEQQKKMKMLRRKKILLLKKLDLITEQKQQMLWRYQYCLSVQTAAKNFINHCQKFQIEPQYSLL